mgnify:FL=1
MIDSAFAEVLRFRSKAAFRSPAKLSFLVQIAGIGY